MDKRPEVGQQWPPDMRKAEQVRSRCHLPSPDPHTLRSLVERLEEHALIFVGFERLKSGGGVSPRQHIGQGLFDVVQKPQMDKRPEVGQQWPPDMRKAEQVRLPSIDRSGSPDSGTGPGNRGTRYAVDR
jgi:hypothetical protein